MPQYSYAHGELRVGQITSSLLTEVASLVNPLLPQEGTFTFAGFADGTRTVTVEFDGETFDFDVAIAGAANVADAADQLAAGLAADPDAASLFDFDGSANPATYSAKEHGKVYDVSVSGATIATAVTQAAGGTDIPIGLGVVAQAGGPSVGTQHCALPGGSAVDADFLGIVVRRNVDLELNDITRPNESEAAKPGQLVSVLKKGECAVRVEDAVAFNGAVYMRIANGTDAAPLGGFRSDADGGDAILITGLKFQGATSGAGKVKVKSDRL